MGVGQPASLHQARTGRARAHLRRIVCTGDRHRDRLRRAVCRHHHDRISVGLTINEFVAGVIHRIRPHTTGGDAERAVTASNSRLCNELLGTVQISDGQRARGGQRLIGLRQYTRAVASDHRSIVRTGDGDHQTPGSNAQVGVSDLDGVIQVQRLTVGQEVEGL